jgi:hypothetical protein
MRPHGIHEMAPNGWIRLFGAAVCESARLYCRPAASHLELSLAGIVHFYLGLVTVTSIEMARAFDSRCVAYKEITLEFWHGFLIETMSVK